MRAQRERRPADVKPPPPPFTIGIKEVETIIRPADRPAKRARGEENDRRRHLWIARRGDAALKLPPPQHERFFTTVSPQNAGIRGQLPLATRTPEIGMDPSQIQRLSTQSPTYLPAGLGLLDHRHRAVRRHRAYSTLKIGQIKRPRPERTTGQGPGMNLPLRTGSR